MPANWICFPIGSFRSLSLFPYIISVVLPNGIAELEEGLFSGCKSLKSISIPNSVTYIQSSVFQRCNALTSVVIPESVKKIGDSAFSSCAELTDVYFLGEPAGNIYAFKYSRPEYISIHVMGAYLDAAKASEKWSKFKEVVAIDEATLKKIKNSK